MSGTVIIVSIYIGISIALSIVGTLTLRRRDARGVWYLTLMCLSGAQWALMEGLLVLSHALEVRVLLSELKYVGLAMMVPMALLFVVCTYEPKIKITATRILLVMLPSVVTFLLVWTNRFHHLMWSGMGLEPWGAIIGIELDYGPGFWAFLVYNYALLVTMTVILIRRIVDGSRMIRCQTTGILVAVLLGWGANIVNITRIPPTDRFDPTPISFLVLAAVLALNFARHSFLDMLPATKGRVFENLADAVIMYDHAGRVVEINTAAERLFRTNRIDAIGKPFAKLFHDMVEEDGDHANTKSREVTIPNPHGGEPHVYDARLNKIRDIRGLSIGGAVVFHDITERKRLERRLNHLALTDELTGTSNRRHFIELAQNEFARARRHVRSLVMFMLDLDHFKQINDDYGHEAGDLVLIEVVQGCEESLRAGEALGRIGGEEFAAILPDTDLQSAAIVAERIRNRIENIDVVHNGRSIAVTTSIGMAELSAADGNVQDLLNRADAALYQAKSAGRNCVRSQPSIAAISTRSRLRHGRLSEAQSRPRPLGGRDGADTYPARRGLRTH